MKLFNKKEEQPKDLKQVLKEFKELKEEFKKISEESKTCIKKVGIVRYNPFSNTGSDQSFSIALLDGDNNGMVITSLYSRDGNRVYAKPVNNAKSEYSLSEEENKAIKKANEQRKK
ncbi:DUF4446 family protein [Patescibacteria group bacterium]|nr:DUF4446 family protein [Patescibacteria group bacterium]